MVKQKEIPTNAFGEYQTYVEALIVSASKDGCLYRGESNWQLRKISEDLLEAVKLPTGERFVYMITKVPDKLLYLAEWPD